MASVQRWKINEPWQNPNAKDQSGKYLFSNFMPNKSISPGSTLIWQKALLISILNIWAEGPRFCNEFVIRSTDGNFSSKWVFRHISLATPLFTEAPLGQLRSIIVLFALEFCLSLTSRGDVCISIGLSSKEPNIALCSSSSFKNFEIWHIFSFAEVWFSPTEFNTHFLSMSSGNPYSWRSHNCWSK